jgi:two-component system, cell cycle sensor histidine kinase and response regulator CckA
MNCLGGDRRWGGHVCLDVSFIRIPQDARAERWASCRGIMFASRSPIQVLACHPRCKLGCSIHSSANLQGRGLGLAVVEKILREHGAERTVVSPPGCGTTFQAWFPAAEKLQADTISAAGGQKASKRGTILVVEDEELLRVAVVKGLGRNGFFVLEASDGAGALKVIRSDPGRIDSILLDIVLPGKISSRTVFEEARRIKPGVKIILTSAYTEETAMAAFGEIYGEHFLRKPFHFADLVKLLGDKGVAR